ncbi:MAG: PH domain-containing protein [Candidatus Bathyarchaeota archaeon]|nr:PH domain-containing protein [Candidatus Bathyarchaeota archaeon]
MGKNVETIIRPPTKSITSGTLFKPSKALLYKLIIKSVIVFLFSFVVVLLSFIFVAAMAALDPASPSMMQLINDYWAPVNLWNLITNLAWFIPTLILLPYYVKSIEYSVKAESGDTMPEIYSKRGIFTVTRRHVPFRTITNISSQAGPFDRLFRIGSVHIETAGYSGAQKGPEENLNGIVFYEEVRDFILRELRKFREPYVTGTEVVYPTEEPVPKLEGLDDDILVTLREIRDLLRQKL